jgi:hypothetical protein
MIRFILNNKKDKVIISFLLSIFFYIPFSLIILNTFFYFIPTLDFFNPLFINIIKLIAILFVFIACLSCLVSFFIISLVYRKRKIEEKQNT